MNEQWRQAALETGMVLALSQERVTSEDILATIPKDVTTPNHKSMGSIMKRLEHAGFLTKELTGYENRHLEKNHSRPQQVWVSQVCRRRTR